MHNARSSIVQKKKAFANRIVFTMLFLCMSVLFFQPKPAIAEERLVAINPLDQWTVSFAIDGIRDDALCTLSRTYFKGYEVHLSLNRDKEVRLITKVPSSFNLYGNLQNAVLVEQDSYAVDMDYIRAGNDHVLFSVDNDLSYFVAIGDTGVLKFPYERVIYYIALDSFKTAIGMLEGCYISETGDQSEILTEFAQEIRGAYQEEPELLENLIQRAAQGDGLALIARSANISGDNGKEIAATDRLIKSLTQKLSLLEREKETLRIRLSSMENDQLSKIKNSVSKNKDKFQYEKRIEYLTKKIEALERREAVSKRDGKLKTLAGRKLQGTDKFILPETDPGAYRFMTSRITALAHKNVVLQQRLGDMRVRLNDKSDLMEAQSEILQLQDQMQMAKEENENLRERRRILDMIATDSVADPLVATGNIISLANEKNKLYSQIEELHSAYNERNELVKMSEAIEALLNQVDELQSQNQFLKQQKQETLSALRDENDGSDRLGPQHRITPDLYQKMEMYDALGEGQKQPSEKLDPSEDKLMEGRIGVDAIREELEKEYRAALEQMAAEKRKLVGEVTELYEENRSLNEKVDLKKGQLVEDAQNQARQVGLSENQTLQIITQMKNQVENLVVENDALKTQLGAAVEKIEEKEDEVVTLGLTLDEADEALKSQIQALKEDLNNKEALVQKLERDLSEKQQLIEQKMRDESVKEQEVTKHKAEYEQIKERIETLHKDNEVLARSVVDYQNTERDRDTKLSASKTDLENLHKNRAELLTENETLKAKNEIVQTFENTQEYSQMRDRIGQLNSKSDALTDRVAALKSKLQEKDVVNTDTPSVKDPAPLSADESIPLKNRDVQSEPLSALTQSEPAAKLNEMMLISRENLGLRKQIILNSKDTACINQSKRSSQLSDALEDLNKERGTMRESRNLSRVEAFGFLTQENRILREKLAIVIACGT